MWEKNKEDESEIYEISIPDEGTLTMEEFAKETNSKLKDVNYILLGVVVILMVMVATLVIDSFHINSATYEEYSKKMEAIENFHEINGDMINQNRENQLIIVEQQRQIQDLIKSQELSKE